LSHDTKAEGNGQLSPATSAAAESPIAGRVATRPFTAVRDVQELAGHSSLGTTQRYIQGDTDAKRKVVDL